MLLTGTAFAASAQNIETLEDEAVDWLQEFIRVDTINPPGNEQRAVDFYARIFEAEGITYETAESAPGRGNIWARLEGGDEPGLILLQHTDVVPADEEFWTIPPLSGEIRDGYVLGRGTRDMKGLGITQLASFLSLHRSGRPLNRDVIFLATADEEAGGYFGVGWLIENRPEIFDGVGFLLNEGGGGSRDGEEIVFSTDAGIYRILREGITGTAMLPVPADTPDPTVWQTVAYINSLRTDPANIQLPGIASQGLALYNGKGNCTSCHMINGEGGRLGPDMSFVGEKLDPDELATALTDPDADVAPRWWTVRVQQRDGSIVEGLRMDEDTFGIRVMDVNANLWSFQKNQVDSYEREQSSTMPGYAQSLTENEIDHLVAYLFSLRKEN